jgi:hypothetical protein
MKKTKNLSTDVPKIGDVVEWVSAAAGSFVQKRGKVVEVVLAQSVPRLVPGDESTRTYDSVFVQVTETLNWTKKWKTLKTPKLYRARLSAIRRGL